MLKTVSTHDTSIIDESKSIWPIEPLQVTLTRINAQKKDTTAHMNSVYNQTLLEEQSRSLTEFVINNQLNEFKRLFYGIFIGPPNFSAFLSKVFRQLTLFTKIITYLDNVFIQSQTKKKCSKF